MSTSATRVLLVDDEVNLLDMAQTFLVDIEGFEVQACSSAREAILALDKERYDAIVSDYFMPDMDGLEFLREVRASCGRMPFILFTGRGREEVVIDALNNGADFYLQKGRDPATIFGELARKVQQAVGRSRVEKTLRDAEERFRLITDNIPDGIWIMDMGLNITYACPSIAAHRGYSQAELERMRLDEHLTPESYLKATRALQEELTPERLADPSLRLSRVIELEFRHSDGSTHLSEESVTLIRDAEGKPICFLGVGRNIGDKEAGATAPIQRCEADNRGRRVEDAEPPPVRSPEVSVEVERKMAILNDITRHDILNQLTVIGLTVGLLKQQARDARTMHLLDMTETAAENIGQQVRFCREYETVGSSAPCWQPLAASARDALRAAEERGVTVVVSLGQWELFADPMLSKVFHNLVDNSLRHGGHIGRILIEATLEDGDLVVDYADDGVGIEEQEKARLFIKGHGKNTGLGLFMVKEILSITDVQISEDGIPGKGVRFRIRAPPGKYREN